MESAFLELKIRAISFKEDHMPWYELMSIEKSELNLISADIHVPPESPWFCGHFPKEPILPGIAQLGMVFDAIHRLSEQNLKIANISRVRFKQIIRPGDRLKIAARPQKGDDETFSFRIMVAGEVACSGVMALEHGEEKVGNQATGVSCGSEG